MRLQRPTAALLAAEALLTLTPDHAELRPAQQQSEAPDCLCLSYWHRDIEADVSASPGHPWPGNSK